MELILRNTDRVVELEGSGPGYVPARIWQGKTSTGIPVVAYVTRIQVAADRPAHELEQFERELKETEAPRADVQAIPTRLIL